MVPVNSPKHPNEESIPTWKALCRVTSVFPDQLVNLQIRDTV